MENNEFEDFVDQCFSEWKWMSPQEKRQTYIDKL